MYFDLDLILHMVTVSKSLSETPISDSSQCWFLDYTPHKTFYFLGICCSQCLLPCLAVVIKIPDKRNLKNNVIILTYSSGDIEIRERRVKNDSRTKRQLTHCITVSNHRRAQLTFPFYSVEAISLRGGATHSKPGPFYLN